MNKATRETVRTAFITAQFGEHAAQAQVGLADKAFHEWLDAERAEAVKEHIEAVTPVSVGTPTTAEVETAYVGYVGYDATGETERVRTRQFRDWLDSERAAKPEPVEGRLSDGAVIDNITRAMRDRWSRAGRASDEVVERRERQFDEWLAAMQAKAAKPKDQACPNCEGTGKINYGNVIGLKDCPVCLGEATLTRADYMSAFGLFLLGSD